MNSDSRIQTVSDGQSVSLSTRYEETIDIAPAVALVKVYTREAYEGPDTLVLRSEDGEGTSDRTYWRELAVRDQRHTQNQMECVFSLDEHQGRAAVKEDLDGLTYQLGWRPGRRADDEILLFENRDTGSVWNLGASRASEEEITVMAHFCVARFQECSAVSFPAEGGLEVDLPDDLKRVYEPLPEEAPGFFPAPYGASAVPVQSRSSSERSETQTSTQDDATVPGSTLPESAPPEGDRWIALYGQFTPGMADLDSSPVLFGAYRANSEGRYKRASLNGDTPSPDGTPQDDVLLPAGCVGAGPVGIFARLILGTPSTERLKQGPSLLQKGKVQESLLPATTPVFLNQSSDEGSPVFQETGPHPGSPMETLRTRADAHVRQSESGPGRVLFLVNPLWAAERRLQAAEAANEHIQDWSRRAAWAGGPSDMVGGFCYDPVHNRQYLKENLSDAPINIDPGDGFDRAHYHVDPDYNMETAWAPFSPEQVHPDVEGSVTGDAATHALGQYLYGYRCKKAFLVWNRNRATRRARTLLGSSLLYQYVLDFYASPAPTDEHASFVNRLFDFFPRLLMAGGFPPLPHASEGDLSGRAPTEDEPPSLQAITGRSLFSVLVELGGKRDKPPYPLVFACAPMVLSPNEQETPPGPSMGAKRYARLLMQAAYGEDIECTQTDDGDYRLYHEHPHNADVVLTQKGEETGDIRRRPWQLELSGRVKSDLEALDELLFPETDRISAIHMVNGFIAGEGAMDYLSSEPFGFDDTSAAATLLVELSAVVDGSTAYDDIVKARVPSWIGEFLLRLGPGLDVLTGARDLGQAAFDTDPRGQAVARDPNYLSMVGAVVSTAGGIAMTVGSGPVAVGGAIGVLMGGSFQWVEDLEDRLDVKAADPLNGWLASEYLWGEAFDARGITESRNALFDAVRPNPESPSDPTTKTLGAKPLPDAFSDQTKAVVERAFYFPTTVGVGTPQNQSTPTGLQFDIAIGYLPGGGTLMVNAQVEAPGVPPVPLRCVVHYLPGETDLRYRVCPSGKRLRLPDVNDADLSQWVQENEWARARTDSLQLGTGELVSASHLELHIGRWPTRFESRKAEQTATYAKRMHVEKELPIAAALYEGLGSAMGQDFEADRRDENLRDNYRQAKQTRETVAPTSHLDGPSELRRILDGGQFVVNGQVYFNPMASFHPRPDIPKSIKQARKRSISFERFRYSYPDDRSD